MLFKCIKEVIKKIEYFFRWHYYLNFDKRGFKNWNNYLRYCLPEIKDKRILDIRCKSGIYDLKMGKLGAQEVIGVDSNVKKALSNKTTLGKKTKNPLNNVKFISKDIYNDGLKNLNKFDFVCLFCAVYHFCEKIDFIMDEISRITDTVVLQGDLRYLSSSRYKGKIGSKYAGIDGMRDLLIRHGFKKIHIFDMDNYPKPVVIGEKECAG